jgi:deoxycytidylate deaminase
MGVNHFPEGVIVTPELLADKKRKSDSIIHAECAGIGDARTRRLSTHGSTLYTNFLPCEPCTEEIIAAGIAKVYGHHPLTMRIPERWIPSLDAGIERLLAHGIDIALVEGHLGGVENVFDGEYWLP